MNLLFKGKMIISRILTYPSILRLFTCLATATFLATSGRRGSALASPVDSGPNTDTSAYGGYPSNKDIRNAFLGVGMHKTVLSAGRSLNPGPIWLFATSTLRVSIYNAFQDNVQPFVYEGHGSREGFSNFIERCTKFLIKKSSGKVWVLSDWPNGPDSSGDCNFWTQIQFPSLVSNNDVESIWLVDRNHFANQKQIWPKREAENPDEPKTQDPRGGRRRQGRPSFALSPLVGLGSSTGLVLGTGVGGLGNLPILPPFDHTNDPGANQQPEIKTDVLDSITGELPSTINAPDGGDVATMSLGTEGIIDTGGLGGSGDGILFKDLDKDWTDYGTPSTRRHLDLQARFDAVCPDWFSDSSNTPFNPSPFDGSTGDSVVLPPSKFVAPGAISDHARVQVTEYDKDFPTMDQTGNYHLEISILNEANEVIGGLQPTDAPPGQALIVWSQLPYALQVSVGSTSDDQTLYFTYAADTPYAKSWDMNDRSDEHKCESGGPWNNGIRGVYCDFVY